MATTRISIDSLAFGGDGVGRDADGRAVFVPHTAPGDDVEVTLVAAKKRFARGRLETVHASSADRVEPPCHLFRDAHCGGCQWQHVSLERQRQSKHEIVVRALRNVVETVEPLMTPVADYGWRRRARLSWRVRGDEVTMGFFRLGSSSLVDVNDCAQLEPALQQAAAAVREHVLPTLRGEGELLLLAGRGGQVHGQLIGADVRRRKEVVQKAIDASPLCGLTLSEPKQSAVFVGEKSVVLADDLGDTQLTQPAGVFAQASHAGNEALRRLVKDAAASAAGKPVLELFCGAGNFTRDLAQIASRVDAVESFRAAAKCCTHNMKELGFADRVFVHGCKVASAPSSSPHTIVLDPPRTGLDKNDLEKITRLGAEQIIYVSCDPMTLARDLQRFNERGYTATVATPVDLMPQTFHVETVVTLVTAEKTAENS